MHVKILFLVVRNMYKPSTELMYSCHNVVSIGLGSEPIFLSSLETLGKKMKTEDLQIIWVPIQYIMFS